MRVGQVFRYARPYASTPEFIDGLPNYFSVTDTPGERFATLDSGIKGIEVVRCPDGERRPAILISSSPHKRGYRETPWVDVFDVDNGMILYYGDNKLDDAAPELALGNSILLEQYRVHNSPKDTVRNSAVPLVFFKRVRHDGRAKGQVAFQGYGIVTHAELVTQFHPRLGHYFANYRFEFCVFSLKHELEDFRWDWIASRRDSHKTTAETLGLAPYAWRRWQRGGPGVIEQCRRRVLGFAITPDSDQMPVRDSDGWEVLKRVYAHYDGKKHLFENLASFLVASYLKRHDVHYQEGWVTPKGSDGGVDFVGRVDLGSGFSRTRLVVLGQAKCEALEKPTGGNHVARTVARLRRGWLGAYVTTSYFSDRVQREVMNDEFPLLLLNGRGVVEELLKVLHEIGFASLDEFLAFVDSREHNIVSTRRPEDILHDALLIQDSVPSEVPKDANTNGVPDLTPKLQSGPLPFG